MKFTKKLMSTLFSLLLIVALMVSIGSLTASAAITDVDVYGTPINHQIDEFISDWDDHFETRKQCTDTPITFVFIDSQLLEFNFMERLCDFYGVSYDMEGIALLTRATNTYFIIQQSQYVFYNISWESVYGDENDSYVYDFANTSDLQYIYDLVGEISMCALGIWQFDAYMYNFLYFLQNAWNDNLPIYVIEREPIVYSEDGLKLYVYGRGTGSESFGFGSNVE